MTNEQLVRDYRNGDTYQVIADRYGITRQAVGMRVRRLRAAGVELRARPRRKPVDVDALNAIVPGSK